MPAIQVLGRRWLIGSDDLLLPAFVDVSVKICWFAAALYVYIFNQDQESKECVRASDYFEIYLYGLFLSLGLIILDDFLVIRLTLMGPIIDRKNIRGMMPNLVHARLFLELIDISWNILGTVWAFGPMLHCEEHPEIADFARRFTLCNWFSILVIIWVLSFHWDPLGSMSLDIKDMSLYERFDENGVPLPFNAKFWDAKSRVLTCFCCPTWSTGLNAGFAEIGRLFGFLFRGEDLVLMDIVAGFIALYLKPQKTEEEEEEEEAAKKEINGNIIDSEEKALKESPYAPEILASKEDIYAINHFIKYIEGSYGWQGYLCGHRPVSALIKEMYCCGIIRSSEMIHGDNICSCNTSAVKVLGKEQGVLTDDDLVFISFENKPYVAPFYVALDHSTKSVVIVVRGTLSYSDIVTDLTGLPMQMNIPGIPSTFKAHHGMYLTAENVYRKLKKNRIIERALNSHPDYNIVLVGQSLGGTVSIICGMMLLSQYPKLKVYAISPSGGALNAEATDFCESFTTSIVYGDDVIARTSIAGLHQLKFHVIKAIHSVKTQKNIITSGFFRLVAGKELKLEFYDETEEDLRDLEAERKEVYDKSIDMSQGKMEKPNNLASYPMYLPGKILHVEEIKGWVRGSEGRRFTFKWKDRKDFLEIVISPRMYADHWHFRMVKALREYAQLTNKDSTMIDIVPQPLAMNSNVDGSLNMEDSVESTNL